MKVTLHSGETKELDSGPLTVEAMLQELDISPAEVLVVMGGEVIPEDRLLKEEDEVRILHVVFGG